MRRIHIAAILLSAPVLMMPAAAVAAHFGDALAAYFLEDYETAHAQWRTLAQSGDTESRYYLGLLYETGRGVEANPETAIAWYQKAAAAGHGDAAYRLSRLARDTDHLTADPAKILQWIKTAAEGGIAEAQYELGAIYAEGRFTDPDLHKARTWFGQAADNFPDGAERRLARAMKERIDARLAP